MGLKPALATVVSSHWSGQRGEFPVLHHSDGCVQLHYARAAGSPGCRGRSSDSLAPLAQGALAKVNGSGALSGHRPGSWPMGRAGQWWGAVVVRRMIYRCAG